MLEIRTLKQHREFVEVVELQKQIWGYQDVELLPSRLFVVADKVGGQVLGAFDGERMVAFCFCIPGIKPGGKYYLHSHMLGVLPEYRDTGLGRQLKIRQREDALTRGIELIEWTFDPLETKNAYFNIERLGAIVRRFVRNQYGISSSRLHGGLPTDRLIAEWWIQTPRADAIANGRPFQRNLASAHISVPFALAALRTTDPVRAREMQAAIADQFDQHSSAGLAVIGFEKSGDTGTYLLGQWESQ